MATLRISTTICAEKLLHFDWIRILALSWIRLLTAGLTQKKLNNQFTKDCQTLQIDILLLIFLIIKINSINAYSCVAYSNWIFICFLKFIRATRNEKRLPIQYLTIHNKNYFYSIVLSISALWKHWAYPHKLGETRDYPQRWHNALCRHFWVMYARYITSGLPI